MKHTLASKAIVKLLVIGDVVLMSEKHQGRAIDVLRERLRVPRRIDEHIPPFSADQVTDRSKRRFTRVPTPIDIVRDVFRQRRDGPANVVLLRRSDRRGWA